MDLYLMQKINDSGTSQMMWYHKLNEILPSLLITCNNENVEQVKSWKLVCIEFDQNLEQSYQQ